MSSAPEVVATGVLFGEGPVWVPADGDRPAHLVFTAVAGGVVQRLDLETGTVTLVADVGGGANAALLTSDGGFLVTQNGGIDFTQVPLYDDPPPYRPVTPGLQRITPDGSVSYLLDASTDPTTGEQGPFVAPNDLVVAADGTLWFTDPPHHPPSPDRRGRVHAMGPDGTARVVARDFFYCNGIALDPDGTPVVIEETGLLRLQPDGTKEWITEHVSPTVGDTPGFRGVVGDGLCLDADGRYYVAATSDHGIRVLEHDGTEVDFLAIPEFGVTTNCCFGGDDARTLFVTDGVPGQVVAFTGMPTPGLPLHRWPVRTA
jgi:gluconolactonase